MAGQSFPDWIDGAVVALKAISLREDFYEAVAISTKKQFDALVAVGFTEEQATRIVAGFSSKNDK